MTINGSVYQAKIYIIRTPEYTKPTLVELKVRGELSRTMVRVRGFKEGSRRTEIRAKSQGLENIF